jgi:hypothetical protein
MQLILDKKFNRGVPLRLIYFINAIMITRLNSVMLAFFKFTQILKEDHAQTDLFKMSQLMSLQREIKKRSRKIQLYSTE